MALHCACVGCNLDLSFYFEQLELPEEELLKQVKIPSQYVDDYQLPELERCP